MNWHTLLENSFDSKLQKLENELFHAYELVISLVPSKFRDILQSYYRCKTIEDTHRWKQEVCEEIIGNAEIVEQTFYGDRAYCPLCKTGSSSPYVEGFTVPEGLRRHLTGWGGNRGCEVMHLVHVHARKYWDGKFQSIVESQRKEKARVLEERKKKETLYLTEPNTEPKLLDTEDSIFSTRSIEGVEWAESRLQALGFVEVVEGNVKSYTDTRTNVVVYANPITKGRILFHAYKYPIKRKAQRISFFDIRDSWKHGLKEKYEAWLQTAI